MESIIITDIGVIIHLIDENLYKHVTKIEGADEAAWVYL